VYQRDEVIIRQALAGDDARWSRATNQASNTLGNKTRHGFGKFISQKNAEPRLQTRSQRREVQSTAKLPRGASILGHNARNFEKPNARRKVSQKKQGRKGPSPCGEKEERSPPEYLWPPKSKKWKIEKGKAEGNSCYPSGKSEETPRRTNLAHLDPACRENSKKETGHWGQGSKLTLGILRKHPHKSRNTLTKEDTRIEARCGGGATVGFGRRK